MVDVLDSLKRMKVSQASRCSISSEVAGQPSECTYITSFMMFSRK